MLVSVRVLDKVRYCLVLIKDNVVCMLVGVV